MKVVLDTNVLLVSISRKSPYYPIYESLLRGDFQFLVIGGWAILWFVIGYKFWTPKYSHNNAICPNVSAYHSKNSRLSIKEWDGSSMGVLLFIAYPISLWLQSSNSLIIKSLERQLVQYLSKKIEDTEGSRDPLGWYMI